MDDVVTTSDTPTQVPPPSVRWPGFGLVVVAASAASFLPFVFVWSLTGQPNGSLLIGAVVAVALFLIGGFIKARLD